MGAIKNDTVAQQTLGRAYSDTPKSAFALIAYYLAERIGGGCESAEAILAEEARALASNDIITPAQARALSSLNGQKGNGDA